MNTTIIATTTQRVFWICRVCGHKETIDYTADTFEKMVQGRRLQCVDVHRMVGGKRSTPWDERSRPCPACGARYGCWNERVLKKIVAKESHRCDVRCEMAVSEKCECSCNGAHHGIAWLISPGKGQFS